MTDKDLGQQGLCVSKSETMFGRHVLAGKRSDRKVSVAEKDRVAKNSHAAPIFSSAENAAVVPAQKNHEPQRRSAHVNPHHAIGSRSGPAASPSVQRHSLNSAKLAKFPQANKNDDENRGPVIILAMAAIAIALVVAFQQGVHLGELGGGGVVPGQRARPTVVSEKFKQSVDFYRQSTGVKMNRERMQQALENNRTAPALMGTEQAPPKDNSMEGVPLVPEGYSRRSARDRAAHVNPDNPDTHVMATLQEEQDAREWERRADQQYVQDFVNNAAAAGYRVKLDKNLNVIKIERAPTGYQGYAPPPGTVPAYRGDGGAAQ
jgi:hypothetical protein